MNDRVTHDQQQAIAAFHNREMERIRLNHLRKVRRINRVQYFCYALVAAPVLFILLQIVWAIVHL